MKPEPLHPELSGDAVDPDPTGAAKPSAPPRRPRRRLTAVLVTLAVAGAGAGRAWAARPAQHPSSEAPRMALVAPDGVLDLGRVSSAIAAEYGYAADHGDAYRQMRCWCGCEQAFAHQSLLDCFVRADRAWEAHGAYCAVCITEAMTAHRRLDAGDTPADIARDLDAQFGPPSSVPSGA